MLGNKRGKRGRRITRRSAPFSSSSCFRTRRAFWHGWRPAGPTGRKNDINGGQRYTRSDSIPRERHRMEGAKAVACAHCGSTFASGGSLREHLITECVMPVDCNDVYTYHKGTFGRNMYGLDGDLYVVRTDYSVSDHYKVGITVDVKNRMSQYRCAAREPRLHFWYLRDIERADRAMKGRLRSLVKREIYAATCRDPRRNQAVLGRGRRLGHRDRAEAQVALGEKQEKREKRAPPLPDVCREQKAATGMACVRAPFSEEHVTPAPGQTLTKYALRNAFNSYVPAPPTRRTRPRIVRCLTRSRQARRVRERMGPLAFEDTDCDVDDVDDL